MIKILKNGIELDLVKESLSINRENKYLDNDFRIQATNYPFLVIENDNTRNALGSRVVNSNLRDTFHIVSVITPEGTFEGELQILSYLNNYRKCNLKFYSPIYNLKDIKIGSFLPNRISTITSGAQPTFNYEEHRTTLIPSQFMNTWETYGPTLLNKGFPTTLFNLPSYNFPNKFGEDLREDDEWFLYNGTVNGIFTDSGIKYMYSNSYYVNNGVKYINQTVNAPQVYLLAPLKNAIESIGYKVRGSFYDSNFIRRLLFYSEKNNLCEVDLQTLELDIPYVNGGWKSLWLSNIKTIEFQLPVGKRYKVEIQLKNITGLPVSANIIGKGIQETKTLIFENPTYNEIQTYSVDFVTPASGSNVVNMQILLETLSVMQLEPLQFYYIRIYEIAEKKGYLSHPIINLQRYVPDWSFVDYINELKKLFNLKITTNDHDKTISLDFFNSKFADTKGIEIDAINLPSYETLEYDSLLLSYDNSDDKNVLVTKTDMHFGNNQLGDHTKEIKSKFKFMPVSSSGLILTQEDEDKGGVGLIIYDHTKSTSSAPSENYNGFSLSLDNIYKNNYKLPFKNYLNTGVYKTNVFLTNNQIKNVTSEDFVLIDNRRYYVNAMSYKETPNGLYETTFELLLMIY